MTHYNPQYPPYPAPPPAGSPQMAADGGRRFPFVAGYVLWFMPALWRDAGRRWRGIGFVYMLLLVALSWAAVMGKQYPSFKRFVRNDVPKFAAQVPNVDINNGVVTTDAPEPHVITNPEDGQPLVIIDTTGATTEPPAAPSVLLTRDKLIVRQQNKMETHDLSGIQSFHVDGKRVQGWADAMLGGYWTLGFPLLVIFSFVLRLLQMLLFGVIALLVASSVRPPLGFAACMRLAALAMTPVILLDTVFWLTGLNVGCAWFLIALALEVTLLIFMVRANDDPRAEPPGGFTPAFGYGSPPPGGPYSPQGYAPPPAAAGYGAPAQGYPPAPPSYTTPPPPPPRPGA